MRRRTHRYGNTRPRTGATVATIVMMCVLLAGIFVVGGDFASRLAGFFSTPAPEPEGGVESLPPSLDEPAGAPEPSAPVVDDALVPHTGALVRMAIRSASIVARRAIARGHAPQVPGHEPP